MGHTLWSIYYGAYTMGYTQWSIQKRFNKNETLDPSEGQICKLFAYLLINKNIITSIKIK